ncbi:uncharacterized protein LOC106083718 isoform X1 [Stomoxys calcitrans]|uniref:uncharacterized protein LOC106083718 isoform X1 n=1 Tax=Stomoxys calcitrans TaxID=35570 RepID=UPI0027E30B80|nr:uncharacterized protein LOC106083718 isoform X1 [Stomoxys calcitrans]
MSNNKRQYWNYFGNPINGFNRDGASGSARNVPNLGTFSMENNEYRSSRNNMGNMSRDNANNYGGSMEDNKCTRNDTDIPNHYNEPFHGSSSGNSGFGVNRAGYGDFNDIRSERFENCNNISYPTAGRVSVFSRLDNGIGNAGRQWVGHNKQAENDSIGNLQGIGGSERNWTPSFENAQTLLGKRRFITEDDGGCFEESYPMRNKRYAGPNDVYQSIRDPDEHRARRPDDNCDGFARGDFMMGKRMTDFIVESHSLLSANCSTQSDGRSNGMSECRDASNQRYGHLQEDDYKNSQIVEENVRLRFNRDVGNNVSVADRNDHNKHTASRRAAEHRMTAEKHKIPTVKPSKPNDKSGSEKEDSDEDNDGKIVDEADKVVIPSPFKRVYNALDWDNIIQCRRFRCFTKKFPIGPTKQDPENYWRNWWKSYAYIENVIEKVDRKNEYIRFKTQFRCGVGNTWQDCAHTYRVISSRCKRRIKLVSPQFEMKDYYKFFKYRAILRDVYLHFRRFMSKKWSGIVGKNLRGLTHRGKIALLLQNTIMEWHHWKELVTKFERAEISLSDDVTLAYSMLNYNLFNFIVYECIVELKNICSDDWPGFNEYYKRLQY